MPSRVSFLKGNKTYKNLKYPEIPLSVNDIYVITTTGDRHNLLI